MKSFIYLCLGLFVFTACKEVKSDNNESKKEEPKRIVSLNGTITEIIYALQEEKSLVGIDVTSTYPSATAKMTNLGHISQINKEAIIGLHPTHVLAFEDELSPDLLSALKTVNIEVKTFKRDFNVKSTQKVITEIATWFNNKALSEQICASIENDLKGIKTLKNQPKVLFVYARGAGTLMVGGEGTPIDKMIQLAGGINAATGFEEYKPLTSEAVATANPDVILMFESGAQSLGPNGIFNVPGVNLTNAGKNKQLITMDGQFLSGFSPRVGKALLELNKALEKL